MVSHLFISLTPYCPGHGIVLRRCMAQPTETVNGSGNSIDVSPGSSAIQREVMCPCSLNIASVTFPPLTFGYDSGFRALAASGTERVFGIILTPSPDQGPVHPGSSHTVGTGSSRISVHCIPGTTRIPGPGKGHRHRWNRPDQSAGRSFRLLHFRYPRWL